MDGRTPSYGGGSGPGGGPPDAPPHPGRKGLEPDSHRFPRHRRLRSGPEIRKLFREGRKRRTRHLDVFVLPNPEQGPRFGLVVPKHRRRVVDRNRLRRRLRELGRVELLPVLERGGFYLDVLVRARTETYHAPFRVLEAEMREVAEAICSGQWSWP